MPLPDDTLVAYFSLEYGLREELPIYAGGLGILAGDHLKSASDLDVPLVAVGLFYREGYFRQVLGPEGQEECYDPADPAALGLRCVGSVQVELRGVDVEAAVWRLDVGSVPLLLLETDVEGNPEWARAVTHRLYGGDRETRLEQELVLGIGGVRALTALGFKPTVFHLNEGHAAFTAVERLRVLTQDGLSDEEALERIRATTVFTTHTPVPAGNEVFEQPLVRSLVQPLADRSWDELEPLGRGTDGSTRFGLTPFALRTSDHRNAVSRLHGEVARAMWAPLWPELSRDDVPIGHVTNGVHPRTWLAPRLAELLAACGVELDRGAAWECALGLDLDALAGVRRAGKEALLRRYVLDPEALTIGFARRFATYKRAGLLLSRREELAALLGDDERPLQILFAGKAHPNDAEGKAMLAEVARFCRSSDAGGRAVFVENYDLEVARELVQGVDVWLNVPRRGEEASGTSGMKAALNGALNLSVLDGWWDEGYDEIAGWAIPGSGAVSDQYAADAAEVFRVLEDEVLPEYYGGGWIERSRATIARTGARFSSQRMVREYVEGYYEPAARAAEQPAGALPD